jgi:hypothetical protein
MKWAEFANWSTIAGDDERFALIESSHDVGIVVA